MPVFGNIWSWNPSLSSSSSCTIAKQTAHLSSSVFPFCFLHLRVSPFLLCKLRLQLAQSVDQTLHFHLEVVWRKEWSLILIIFRLPFSLRSSQLCLLVNVIGSRPSQRIVFSKRRQRHLHSEYFICLQSQLGEGGVLSFLSLSAPVIVFSLKYVSHGMSEWQLKRINLDKFTS